MRDTSCAFRRSAARGFRLPLGILVDDPAIVWPNVAQQEGMDLWDHNLDAAVDGLRF